MLFIWLSVALCSVSFYLLFVRLKAILASAQEAAYLARKEAERVANEAASKEREIAALEADANRAKHIVSELKGSYSAWREGALGVAQGENGMLLWTSVPPSATAGSSIQLLYNRTAGPLGSIPIPENEHLILKIGHNSWTNPMDIKMTRTATVKGATSSDGKLLLDIDICRAKSSFFFLCVNFMSHEEISKYYIRAFIPSQIGGGQQLVCPLVLLSSIL